MNIKWNKKGLLSDSSLRCHIFHSVYCISHCFMHSHLRHSVYTIPNVCLKVNWMLQLLLSSRKRRVTSWDHWKFKVIQQAVIITASHLKRDICPFGSILNGVLLLWAPIVWWLNSGIDTPLFIRLMISFCTYNSSDELLAQQSPYASRDFQ